jgi:atypical dual specificity phosphatase
MYLRRLRLPPELRGQVWLSPMPGRSEEWSGFLARAARAGLTEIVCLTPRHEITTVSPAYGTAIEDGSLPFRWSHLPMHNFGLSLHADAFRDGIDRIAASVQNGEVVLMHCAAGIGRTGTAAACLLKRLGLSRAEALKEVRDAGSSPESAEQSGLIDKF